MATKLTLTVPAIPVQRTDVVFDVMQDDELLGRLKISRGGVDWTKKRARGTTRSLSWAQFRDLMES